MKKFLSILLSAILITTSILFTSSASAIGKNEVYLAEVECNYSTDEMSDLVKYSFLDKGRNYTISNGITVYNSDTDMLFYIFPVFDGGVCAALIHYDGNGNYTLSSDVSVYDAVLNLESGEYILYISKQVYYAESEDKTVELGTTGYAFESFNSYADLEFNEKLDTFSVNSPDNDCIFTSLSSITAPVCITSCDSVSTTDIAYPMGPVPQLVEEKCNITWFVLQHRFKICWAACIATIVNYKLGYYVTAEEVADFFGIGRWIGATVYEIRSFLGQYGLSYAIYVNKLPWSNVRSNISSDKPFILAMTGLNSKGEAVAHPILGYGYSCSSNDNEANSDNRYIRAWNPNGSHLTFKYNDTTTIIDGVSLSWSQTVY